MNGYIENIEQETIQNNYFRQVLYTSQHLQLVVMSLNPKEDIGEEVHEIVDQFLRIEEGEGVVIMNDIEHPIKSGDCFVVPALTKHNVKNTSSTKKMKIYTIYSPPHHKQGVTHKTKQDAELDVSDHI